MLYFEFSLRKFQNLNFHYIKQFSPNSNITINLSMYVPIYTTLLSHWIVQLSHWIVPTSLLIVLLSHIWWYPIFFLTFDNSIVTLGSTNITSNHTFVTFGGTIIFFLHVLTIPSSHWVIPTLLMTVLFSHLVGPLLFFFHI